MIQPRVGSELHNASSQNDRLESEILRNVPSTEDDRHFKAGTTSSYNHKEERHER